NKCNLNNCIVSASSLIGLALPVIGFSRTEVITQNNIKIVVPIILIEDHILTHCLIIGTSQNTGADLQLKIKYQRYQSVYHPDKIYKFI
ncbi:MAG: hypothetical protein ACRD6U_06950, partial [Nitrososphaeraceae archaeon]